jgi:hypothetical protein
VRKTYRRKNTLKRRKNTLNTLNRRKNTLNRRKNTLNRRKNTLNRRKNTLNRKNRSKKYKKSRFKRGGHPRSRGSGDSLTGEQWRNQRKWRWNYRNMKKNAGFRWLAPKSVHLLYNSSDSQGTLMDKRQTKIEEKKKALDKHKEGSLGIREKNNINGLISELDKQIEDLTDRIYDVEKDPSLVNNIEDIEDYKAARAQTRYGQPHQTAYQQQVHGLDQTMERDPVDFLMSDFGIIRSEAEEMLKTMDLNQVLEHLIATDRLEGNWGTSGGIGLQPQAQSTQQRRPTKVLFFDFDDTIITKTDDWQNDEKYVDKRTYNANMTTIGNTDVVEGAHTNDPYMTHKSWVVNSKIIDILDYCSKNEDIKWFIISKGSNTDVYDKFVDYCGSLNPPRLIQPDNNELGVLMFGIGGSPSDLTEHKVWNEHPEVVTLRGTEEAYRVGSVAKKVVIEDALRKLQNTYLVTNFLFADDDNDNVVKVQEIKNYDIIPIKVIHVRNPDTTRNMDGAGFIHTLRTEVHQGSPIPKLPNEVIERLRGENAWKRTHGQWNIGGHFVGDTYAGTILSDNDIETIRQYIGAQPPGYGLPQMAIPYAQPQMAIPYAQPQMATPYGQAF